MTQCFQFLLIFCSCLVFSSCATGKQPLRHQWQILSAEKVHANGDPAATTEPANLSCSYFYFLWGSHAESFEQYPEALEAYRKALACDPQVDYVKEKIPILLLKMGEFAKASDWLAQAIKEQPENNTYRLLLANLYIQQERVEDAIVLYKEILAREPDNEAVQLRLALLYSHLQQFDTAEKIFQKILAKDAESYFTHLSYARLLKEMERYPDAAREYEKAFALNWSKDLAFELGYFYVGQKMFNDALRIYTTITDNDQFDEQAALSRIQTLLDLGRTDDALKELYSTRLFSKDQANIDLIISKVLLRVKKVSEARKILTRLVKENNSSEARYMLALIAYQEKDYKTSLAHLRHIDSESEEFEEAVYLQTRIHQKMGNTEKAIKLLTSHTGADSNRNPLFYALLSSLYQAQGDNHAAMKVMETAVGVYPDNAQLLFEYGLILEKNGMGDQALSKMEKVLELQPDHAEALNYIGYTWADRNVNLDKALLYILKANSLKPESGFIIDSLGWVYYRLGNFEQAAEELEHSVELVPDDPHIYQHLGDVYRSLNKNSDALKAYKKAYQLFKDKKNKAGIKGKIDALEKR